MGILDNITNAIAKTKEIALSGFVVTNERDNNGFNEKKPVQPDWMVSPIFGQPRNANITEIREFAQSCWVQMVLNAIKKEVINTEFEYCNADSNDKNEYTEDIKKLKKFFEKINSNKEDIYDLMLPVISDVGEIDAGVWVKVFDNSSYEERKVEFVDQLGNSKGIGTKRLLKPIGQRKLKEVWYGDGSTFLKQTDPYRRLLAYYQYSFRMPKQAPKEFLTDEVIYFMNNRRSYSLYGFSPLQSIVQVIELLAQSTRWNKDYFKNNAVPDAIIALTGTNDIALQKFKDSWEKSLKGNAHKTAFVNSQDIKVHQLTTNAQDMQWLDGQKWFFHIVFGAYGLSPSEAGFYENSNRSTQEGQERVTIRNAIIPYLKMFERNINRHLVPEILQTEDPKVKVRLVIHSHDEEQIKFDQSMREIQTGTLTINEYRKERGRDKVDWGETPGLMNDMYFGGNDDDNSNMDNDKDSINDSDEFNSNSDSSMDNSNDNGENATKKTLSEITAGNDVIDESEDYEDVYLKILEKWESQVIKALENAPLTKSNTVNLTKSDMFIKTFGEFVRDLMNAINATPFVSKLMSIIKRDMIAGLESAEEELGVQIGAGLVFNDKVKSLANQELDGYTINGAKWHGIKGATKELQLKILKIVENNVRNKVPMKETVEDIKSIFAGAATSQAKRIARTETNRFINEGKLAGYIDSGIKGKKAWDAVLDNHTSEICERLEAKYGTVGIPFDEPFIDDVTGKSFMVPPAHPNCRSVISFRSSK